MSGVKYGQPVESSAAPTRSPDKSMRNCVCVAKIGAAHGTGGEVRLWPFTTEPEAVGAYGILQTADGKQAFEIETLRPAGEFLVVRFRGVTDRAAAERLRNIELYVPRERLPVPDPDEFYYADLIGLQVHDTGGKTVGIVIAVHNFGAGDLLEIAPADGGESVMLPFSVSTVPTVEIAAGRIVVDLPEGWVAPDPSEAAARSSTLGTVKDTGR